MILNIEKNNRKQCVNQTRGKGQSTAPAPLPPSTTVGAFPLCVQRGMRTEGVKRGGSMQTRGSTNKSPIKLSVAEIKLTWWFVYEWGKPTRLKPHQVILRSPLPRIHYYHNKRLQIKESQHLIPTYSWTLTLIPNWTCFVVTISPFDARLLVCD